MKNAQMIADMTKDIVARDQSTWITLYYSFADDAVYTEPMDGAFQVTRLINPNTEQDIIDAVTRWKLD